MQNDLYRRCGKRTFDILTSSIALVILSPILLVCAVLVRLTSRGPVFFRQTRLGLGGKSFRIIKFRTMRVGSERLGPTPMLPGDTRVTAVGHFLRRTKVDELPQLINVLLGDMSLVGPRPRVPAEVDIDRPDDRVLLSVRPGVTSYASIYHRMEADYCAEQDDPKTAYRRIQFQKGSLDSQYVKNVSFGLDLKLIFLTFLLVFVPGKHQPKNVQFFGMELSPYGKVGQAIVETIVFMIALWLAYWLRYEGNMPEFNRWQLDAFIVLLPATRLAVNYSFGIYNTIWRYANLADSALLALSLSMVTALMIVQRLVLPETVAWAHVFQLPLSILAMEYLLSLSGCLGLRALRRALYEMNHRYQPLPTIRRRRLLILGAGLSGLGVALEIGRYPHLELVGFLDDDPSKQGRLVAGYTVLGPCNGIYELMRKHDINDLIICAHSLLHGTLLRISEVCQTLGVKIHVIPTLEDILEPDAPEEVPLDSVPGAMVLSQRQS